MADTAPSGAPRSSAGSAVLVIGLGRFGSSIASTLDRLGQDVLAVERNPELIAQWAGRIPLVEADATNPEALEQLGVRDFPVAVVGVGSYLEASVLITGNLVDVGTLGAIRAGRIAVRPAIDSSMHEAVRFADGRVETFHAIVLATGYDTGLDALFGNAASLLDDDGRPHVADDKAASGLYFCGFRIVPAGLLGEIAREAPRIAAKIVAA